MSRPTKATLAGIAFVLAYMALSTELYILLPKMHWAVEAVYWLVAGIVWVFPVRWLMLWSVYKR